MNRAGGEAMQLTDVNGHLENYESSPDSKRLALVVHDPSPNEEQNEQGESNKPKIAKPIVIDRYPIAAFRN